MWLDAFSARGGSAGGVGQDPRGGASRGRRRSSPATRRRAPRRSGASPRWCGSGREPAAARSSRWRPTTWRRTACSRWPHGRLRRAGVRTWIARRAAGARTAILAARESPATRRSSWRRSTPCCWSAAATWTRRATGPSPGDAIYGVEPDRDAFEIDLVREAVRAGLPTLCICRGMQVLNVAFGGTLHQHLPDMPGLLAHGVPVAGTESMHDVEVEAGTLMRSATGDGHARPAPRTTTRAWTGSATGSGSRAAARTGSWRRSRFRRSHLDRLDRRGAVASRGHRGGDPRQQGLFDELVRRAAR